MNTLSPQLTHWLDQVLMQPVADLSVSPLAAEASFRRFYRIANGNKTWIVMDSPPEKEQNQQFCHLARIFSQAGLPVPEVLAAEDVAGFYLLTDLGTRDLEAAYQQGDRDAALACAINALVLLQQIEDPQILPYSRTRLGDELGIFSEWFLRGMLGVEFPARLQPCFSSLVTRAATQPQCCIHRDYHCRNLLFSRAGALGIVDFQDALHGPAAYDLASLLRDCYYELPEDEIERWEDYFLQQRQQAGGNRYLQERFRQDLDYCAVQRQLKAIGIFARLKQRDDKPSHLRYISPLLRRLVPLCRRYSELTELGDFLDRLQGEAHRWQS